MVKRIMHSLSCGKFKARSSCFLSAHPLTRHIPVLDHTEPHSRVRSASHVQLSGVPFPRVFSLQVLSKTPESNTIGNSDSFAINEAFTSPLRKVRGKKKHWSTPLSMRPYYLAVSTKECCRSEH